MAVSSIDIDYFLSLISVCPIIDVRSEAEFAHSHIPGAVSMPLFNNEERKVVGTAYKQESRETAIKIGLDLFGKKMVKMVEQVEELMQSWKAEQNGNREVTSGTPDGKKTVLLHCWRGGMRSAGVAWLLDLYGFKVFTLAGGYKNFRNWSLKQFTYNFNFNILGGYTGSGKTYTLRSLKQKGATTIDLESLANHKGSAFGRMGMLPQPSQEMFENALAVELWKSNATCRKKEGLTEQQASKSSGTVAAPPIWLEDESQRIGNLIIPTLIWQQMRTSPLYFLEIPFEQRLKHIDEGYGGFDKEQLVNAVIRIKKRLGGQDTKRAINHLVEDETEECFRILLQYYDRQYTKGLEKRDQASEVMKFISCEHVNPDENAAALITSIK